MNYDPGGTRKVFSSTTCFHFRQQAQSTLESRNHVSNGPIDPLQSWGCDLGAGGCHEGRTPSYSILNFFGMYVICIKDNALFKGEEDVIPQLLSPRLMILHVTYVLLHYGLMIFYMTVDLSSFAWLIQLTNIVNVW